MDDFKREKIVGDVIDYLPKELLEVFIFLLDVYWLLMKSNYILGTLGSCKRLPFKCCNSYTSKAIIFIFKKMTIYTLCNQRFKISLASTGMLNLVLFIPL